MNCYEFSSLKVAFSFAKQYSLRINSFNKKIYVCYDVEFDICYVFSQIVYRTINKGYYINGVFNEAS